MQFRLLLAIIDRMRPDDAEFDARSLYQYVVRHLVASNLQYIRTSTKLISNDLNRLYRMQLVSRRKVKRPTTAIGDSYRGFMYAYRLNKQGRSYVNYLKQTFFSSEFQEHFKKFEMRTDPWSAIPLHYIEKNLGEKLDDLEETYAEYVYLFSKPKRGRHMRFPPRVSFEFVKDLMKEKQQLEQENQTLKADLEACRTELEATRRRRLF
jgi:hypothetical protein